MLEKAKVFVAEDDRFFQRMINSRLAEEGHQVVLVAETLAEALRAIKQFKKLGIQVAVIDGNLDSGDDSGSDGNKLAATIRRLAPQVITVGMSGSADIIDVNVNVGKKRISELAGTITNL